MPLRLPRGLGARMLGIVTLCLVPIGALTAYALWQERAPRQRAAAAEAQQLARLAVIHHQAMIQGARSVLETLARFPELARPDPARCQAVIVALHRDHPEYSVVAVLDRDGVPVCSAIPSTASLADRDYFRRALGGRFAMGGYVLGRLSGNRVLPLAQPILDERGSVRAVIVVGVLPSWLERLFREARLPRDAHVSIIDGQGAIVARYPGADSYVGRSVASLPNWQRLQDSPGEYLLESTGLDGVSRFSAFSPLGPRQASGQAYVSVGVPRSAALAASNQRLLQNLVVFGVVTAAAVGIALTGARTWVLLPARQLADAAARLGGGDLTVRAGPPYSASELG
jgi:hypothetical protein